MSRPVYETGRDLNIELQIATEFGRWFDLEPVKLPLGGRYSIDFGMFRDGKMRSVAEVKDRPGWRKEYGTVILGMSKVRELFSYSKMYVPALFVVRLCGEIHYTTIDQRMKNWHITWMGRTDRNDSADMEPCFEIPFTEFKKQPDMLTE